MNFFETKWIERSPSVWEVMNSICVGNRGYVHQKYSQQTFSYWPLLCYKVLVAWTKRNSDSSPIASYLQHELPRPHNSLGNASPLVLSRCSGVFQFLEMACLQKLSPIHQSRLLVQDYYRLFLLKESRSWLCLMYDKTGFTIFSYFVLLHRR